MMDPIVTPSQMAAIDAEAPEPVEQLIERAGWATAMAAKALLGRSPYGTRVAVFAGGGNNGEDGRRAVPHLERWGARCRVFDIPHGDRHAGPGSGAAFDLVIDACYGTGLRRDFDAATLPFDVGSVPVLAVDIPSGVDGLTGRLRGRPLHAAATVTFAAVKPGLLVGPGRAYAGPITVADIGLDCSRATTWWLDRSDIVAHWPRRGAEANKWLQAVYVVGGSPGLTGAPALASSGALRAGAGYVARSIPGQADGPRSNDPGPIEAVTYPVPGRWAEPVLARLDRFGAAVVGPGLSTEDHTELARYLQRTGTPTVFDAGAIDGLAAIIADRPDALAGPDGPRHVVTPHDGEFARLLGRPPGEDRIAAATGAARRLGAVVLLKGPTTIVAHPDGRALLSTAGDQRLATAGTGDVLSGVIGAGMAGGLDPFHAAGVGAELHGLAGIRGYRVGATAGDLPSQLAELLSDLF